MQTELSNCRRDPGSELTHTVFIRRVRQHDQPGTVRTADNIAGTAQTATHCLADSAQAGIRCMPAENFDVRIELIEREQHEGE